MITISPDSVCACPLLFLRDRAVRQHEPRIVVTFGRMLLPVGDRFHPPEKPWRESDVLKQLAKMFEVEEAAVVG